MSWCLLTALGKVILGEQRLGDLVTSSVGGRWKQERETEAGKAGAIIQCSLHKIVILDQVKQGVQRD